MKLALVYRNGNTRRADELFAKVSKAKEEENPEQFTRRGLLRIVREGSRLIPCQGMELAQIKIYWCASHR